MLTDLCEDLVTAGWRVGVITSDAHYRNEEARLPRRETNRGVEILRVRTTRLARFGLWGRAVDAASYMVGASVRVLFGGRWDACAAMTDPPLLLVPTVIAARVRGSRCIHWAQDLFPQIAAELGVLSKGGVLHQVLARIVRFALARTDLVVAVGERMAERAIEAGAQKERTVVVHNWTDTSFVRPLPSTGNSFAERNGVEGKFVVLYSGNAGRAHSFESTIEAARRLGDDRGIVFLFVGGGPRIGELKQAAASGASSIQFADHVPRRDLPMSLAAASVSLVTEAQSVSGLIVPSKAYGILASGRPLLFVGSSDSDVAMLVRRHECGAVMDPSDAAGLERVIRRWRANPKEVEALGVKARAAAAEYERTLGTRRWAAEAERALKLPPSSGARNLPT